MRTPGNDIDLALGFLFTEGILVSRKQVSHVALGENKVTVLLNSPESVDLSRIERHFYTSSSCGVCGKTSIKALKTVCRLSNDPSHFTVEKELIKTFPNQLREQQQLFKSTGGIHASALFNIQGAISILREDVGRHNSLDKLIGAAFQTAILPLDQQLLLLSGRASFELIQKAAMARIQFVMAVGAPSSLAVNLAKEYDITLVGFLNETRFNIYHDVNRIKI